jgi:epoxyqueuosine reductase
VRNVLIAIGNASPPAPELAVAAQARLADASALVRAAAVWACDRLSPGCRVRERMRHDPDPLVNAELAAITEPEPA